MESLAMDRSLPPLVVQYLYVHQRGEALHYPNARADSSPARVATRYLECALTQTASLRLQDAHCDLALATNVSDASALGRVGAELMARIEALGVQILPTEYRHRPSPDTESYVAARYVLDAILSASAGQPPERQLWFTDLDCVWANPELVFANPPPPDEIGCIFIGYPDDWDAVGFGTRGITRRAIGEMAASMGAAEQVPPWVGGELLSGTPPALKELVRTCDELDAKLADEEESLPTEEQLLTLAAALGCARFRDLSEVVRRVPTGHRNRAGRVEDPSSVGLWHLPAEKGLSMRRVAADVRSGRTARLRKDFANPARLAKRFNVSGAGLLRRIQDDGWIAAQRVRGGLLSPMRQESARAQETKRTVRVVGDA